MTHGQVDEATQTRDNIYTTPYGKGKGSLEVKYIIVSAKRHANCKEKIVLLLTDIMTLKQIGLNENTF